MSAPEPATAALLVASAFVVALLNAAAGPTGGVSFAVMASVLPPQALIPLHGAVEAVSALYRALLLRQAIDRVWAIWFLAGAAFGLPFGLLAAGNLPSGMMQTVLGLFILAGVWWPFGGRGPAVPAWLAGALSTGLTMVFGATGPLVASAMARRFPDPRRLIGTHAAVMAVQHGLKLPLFALAGFDAAPWLWLLAGLCAGAAAGTWSGRRLLGRWDEAVFRRVFRLLMTVLGLRLAAVGTGLL